MTKLNTEHLENILECKILEDEMPLEFINGLAVAKVSVKSKNIFYSTYTVIKEERDSKTNELIEYKIACNDRCFELPAFVKYIIRSGNHFIFKVSCSNDEGNLYWDNYYHYEFNQENNSFYPSEELSGTPTLTENPDIVILSNSNWEQLYHLGERVFIGDRCSEIEDIDGNYFLVTNAIGAKKYGRSIRNHLIFVIDKFGNRSSDVYSRNKLGFTGDGLEVPYEEIEKREIQKLKDTLDGEENQKVLFRKNYENVEQ